MSVKNVNTVAQNIEQLELLLEWFESEEVTVEQATEKYQESLELTKAIEKQLENAKNQVEVIKKKFST